MSSPLLQALASFSVVLLLASFIYNIVDIPIVIMAILDGVMNSMGWIPVGLHVFLAATIGYFTFKKRQA